MATCPQIQLFDRGNILCQAVILGGSKVFIVFACPLNPLLVLHPPISPAPPSHYRYLYPVCGCNTLYYTQVSNNRGKLCNLTEDLENEVQVSVGKAGFSSLQR